MLSKDWILASGEESVGCSKLIEARVGLEDPQAWGHIKGELCVGPEGELSGIVLWGGGSRVYRRVLRVEALDEGEVGVVGHDRASRTQQREGLDQRMMKGVQKKKKAMWRERRSE